MSRLAVLVMLSLTAPAAALAGKKKKKKAESAEAATPTDVVPDVPDDATSRKFAQKLVSVPISNFKPIDTVGAKFLYTHMSFEPDNTWRAEGFVEFDGEKMECSEAGRWSMEAAEADSRATVTWQLDKTDCPGRETGVEVRALLTLDKTGIKDIRIR